MRKLERAKNKALRFTFGIKWDQFISNKKIHTEYKRATPPVNQVLHWRARNIWEGIKDNISGNADMLKQILEIEIDYSSCREKELFKFPPSYLRAMRKN